MKKSLLSITLLFITFLLAGCGKPDTEGIILEVKENGIKLAQGLSSDEYEEIKSKSATEIQNEDVKGNANRNLIDLTYKNTDGFSKGDEVEVWIDGDIMDSYPAQANAKKISKKK